MTSRLNDRSNRICGSSERDVLYEVQKSNADHFLSAALCILGYIASIAKNIFNDGGVVDSIFGKNLHLMSSNSPLIWVTIILINCWKEVGWNAIFICPPWQVLILVFTRPLIWTVQAVCRRSGTSLCRVSDDHHRTADYEYRWRLNVGMERQMLLSNPLVEDHTMVLSWFSYKRGIGNSNYGLGTAIGVFQSAVSVTLLLIANKIAGLVGEDKLM